MLNLPRVLIKLICNQISYKDRLRLSATCKFLRQKVDIYTAFNFLYPEQKYFATQFRILKVGYIAFKNSVAEHLCDADLAESLGVFYARKITIYCKFPHMHLLPKMFPRLESLILNKNIEYRLNFVHSTISKFRYMTFVNIMHMQLAFPNIRKIYVHFVLGNAIPNATEYLETLHATYIEDFLKTIPSLKKITVGEVAIGIYPNIEYAKINKIPNRTMSFLAYNFPHLKKLKFEFSLVENISYLYNRLPFLEKLYLNNNSEEINLAGFPNLKFLDIRYSNNKVIITEPHNLEEIKINSYVDMNAIIHNLPKLKKIHVNYDYNKTAVLKFPGVEIIDYR